MLTETQSRIPRISDERIVELMQRIQPVVRFVHGKYKIKHYPDGRIVVRLKKTRRGRSYIPTYRGELCYIRPGAHPRDVCFTWDPKFQSYAHDLKPLCVITTYHTFGYHGFFKPSIAEVLAQIPEELLGQVAAFEVQGPEDADDLGKQWHIVKEGYHAAQTTLYIRVA